MIAISAGNHAQAVAWGAAEEGLDALVVMWQGASEAKIAATRGYGAVVDLEASNPAEAFARLDVLLEETGRTLVHPFDDPRTIAGQGTVALEILEDLPDVRDDRGARRRRRAHLGNGDRGSRQPRESSVSSPSSRPRCTRRSRRASPST